MARRSDHTRDELKELILKTSKDIIERDGFESLTARHIAKEIGYTPGTIYNLFESMEDLYFQLNSQTLDDLYQILTDTKNYAARGTPVKNIKTMARLYQDFAHKHKRHWLMIFEHSLPEGEKAPDWYREKTARLLEPLEKLLEPFYTQQQQYEQKMAARILWSSIHGLFFLEETGKLPLLDDKKTTGHMAKYLIDNFLKGVEEGSTPSLPVTS